LPEKAPIGRLLAAVGALQFGFGALLATFWRLLESLASIELHIKDKYLATFCQCWAP